jgi:hypothetical protein
MGDVQRVIRDHLRLSRMRAKVEDARSGGFRFACMSESRPLPPQRGTCFQLKLRRITDRSSVDLRRALRTEDSDHPTPRRPLCDLQRILRRLADGRDELSPRAPMDLGPTRLPASDCLWARISLAEFGQELLLSTSRTLVRQSAVSACCLALCVIINQGALVARAESRVWRNNDRRLNAWLRCT